MIGASGGGEISADNEVWVPVIGIPWGLYEISDRGRVKGLARGSSGRWRKERILKPAILAAGGYPSVGLTVNGRHYTRKIHHLLMEAFVGPRLPGQEVRHLNGIPTDNRLHNLKYGTHAENINDTVRHDRTTKGERHGNATLNENQVREILHSSLNNCVLARQYGVGREAIRDIRRGRNWKYIQRPGYVQQVEISLKGEYNPLAKLNEEQVREILCSSLKGSMLARRYGVTRTTISDIRRGRRWKHIPRSELSIPPMEMLL